MQKAIRECTGKQLLSKYLKDEAGLPLYVCQAALVKSLADLETLPATEPWLLTAKLVVKPDQLIKRRGNACADSIDQHYRRA
jgi:ATP citrate (pro-S)-lyase